MKALSKPIMATLLLATVSATALAENVGDSPASSLSGGGQAIGRVALLILVLILPTFKSSKSTTIKTSSKSYY
ncbi:MAG TPA: hypothetical protein VK559_03780 [Ferruginibacter sp.]|nr:hypothetical protein [Ferruginibacter sp.]